MKTIFGIQMFDPSSRKQAGKEKDTSGLYLFLQQADKLSLLFSAQLCRK